MALHQSGPGRRKVYVRLTIKCNHCNALWLLFVAGYGLVNANSEWKNESDSAILQIALHHIAILPQLLVTYDEKRNLFQIKIRIVDDVLPVGVDVSLRFFEDKSGEEL